MVIWETSFMMIVNRNEFEVDNKKKAVYTFQKEGGHHIGRTDKGNKTGTSVKKNR